MRWLFLFLLAAPSLWAQAPNPITSAAFRSNEFTLDWDNTVPGDSALVSVFNVERRDSLTSGTWLPITTDDHTAGFTDTSPPSDRGFYRLVPAGFPLAMVGPNSQSEMQGLILSSPGVNDVIFFRGLTPTNSGTNFVSVHVDGVLRSIIAYSADRQGTEFRYGLAGGPPIGVGTFNGWKVYLSSTGGFTPRAFAEAGAAAARSSLADLVTRFPDSVTAWQNIGGSNTNEATVLYVRASAANTNQGARPGEFGSGIALLGQPLVSGAGLVPVASLADAAPFSPLDPEMVNLNATNVTNPAAFIGTRSMTNAGAPVTAAEWVYVGAHPGPTNATNPPIARYAYWVEDESFKVNVNTATNGPRGTSTNLGPGDLRLDGSWLSSSNAAVQAADAAGVVSARGTNPNFFPTVGSAAVIAGLTDVASAADFRFLTTANSAGLDLSRGGFRRFNLNTITNGVATDALKRTALDRLTAAMTNTNAAPLFGQRFYRLTNDLTGINDTAAVTPHHSGIYLQKIAANIYDYLDSDDQPTVINNDAGFTLRTGRPTEPILAVGGGFDGSNSVAAFGVENFPRLQEWAMHARLWRMSSGDPSSRFNFGFASNFTNPAANPTQANYEIWLDYYFEFYNPGTRDIVVTNAFITLGRLPAFQGVQPGDALANERSITNIPLNARFPAGQITVLTTAAFAEDSFSSNSFGGILTNRSNVVYLPVSTNDRKFTGVTTNIVAQSYDPTGDNQIPPNPNFNRLFQVTMAPGPQTKGSILVGNSSGILESFVGFPFNSQINPNTTGLTLRVGTGWIRSGLMSICDGNNDFLRGGSLRGNNSDANARPSATEGDPRALLEQLEFLNLGSSSVDADQTRFYMTVTGFSGLPEGSTFGSLNTNYVLAANWTDHTAWQTNSTNAPLVVRNAAMQSIGELGHITDPARAPGTSGNVARARGGGRTFRIGQPELSSTTTPWRMAWYDGIQTNASRTWTSWRLADIFSTATNSNVVIPGLINPNGALRDNGAALRAALFNLEFLPSPEGAPVIAGRSASAEAVVTNFLARLTNGADAGLPNALNPLWERGEISELSVFNAAGTNGLVAGTTMTNALDRGREEVVRRSIEMITTRGSIFTAYVIGQSLQVTPTATNVLGTARLKSTFEMTPQFPSPGATNDAFNPASTTQVNQRFSPPTNYTTQVISSSFE